MTRRSRAGAAVCAAVCASLLLAASCVRASTIPPSQSATAARPSASASPAGNFSLSGTGSAMKELHALCKVPPPPAEHVVKARGHTSPVVAKLERQVEAVRHLRFLHPVPTQAVTQTQMAERVRKMTLQQMPTAMLARRSLAWQTIGVIPPGTEIAMEEEKFLTQQVAGFYDPSSGKLVYVGGHNMSSLERLTLAHELVHALDDQHFGLSRLQAPAQLCLDEPADAGTALAEGSAMYFSFQVVTRFFSVSDKVALVGSAASVPQPQGVPPFIVGQEEWPYLAGMQFIGTLTQKGGTAAVNAALVHPPVSTEQVMNPSSYPADKPVSVNVPELAPLLGPGWKDLDVQQVGAAWLDGLLALRLPQSTADAVTSSWKGGVYRAWRDGSNVAVVMNTAWASPQAASDFASAMSRWIDAGSGPPAEVYPNGNDVIVLFASDAATMALLRSTGS